MDIEKLTSGQQFKLERQRKHRTLNKIYPIGHTNNIPAPHRGKLLVIYDGCKQMIVDKGTPVEVP
jgi:hypothetical protein